MGLRASFQAACCAPVLHLAVDSWGLSPYVAVLLGLVACASVLYLRPWRAAFEQVDY